ncbi:MAG: hypothetical protein JNL98_31575 [Bryobacterales bacterium]|nr:hypothetical protein [Bryobacterales bacterium]
MIRKVILPAGLLAASLSTFGQQNREVKEADVLVGAPSAAVTWTAASAAPAQAVHILGAATMDGKVIKNSPYSAEANTEMTRVLSDGTRIVNRHTNSMARDKDGRTRREDNLAGFTPFANRDEQTHRSATIVDPVAKETIILNLNEKTAHKVKVGVPTFFRSERTSQSGNREVKEVREEHVQVMVRESSTNSTASPSGERQVVTGAVVGRTFDMSVPPMAAGGTGAMFMRFDSKNSKTERLGKQVMEGVEVEGTRTTTTIPTGEIGNDRPIVSVSERWYSNELQMVIYSKTNDPQFGDTIYRVSNLRRTEPSADLFKIPADFKVAEPAGGPGTRVMLHREAKP